MTSDDDTVRVGADRAVTTAPTMASELLKRYGGHPTHRQGSEGSGDHGLLRLVFTDDTETQTALDEDLTEITWEEFREEFDEKELALVYPESAPERPAEAFELVKRDAVE